MIGKSHRKTTRIAVEVLSEIIGDVVLVIKKDVIASESVETDNMRDLEFVDVDWGKDDPHVSEFFENSDEAHYSADGKNFTAFNHFIDIKKGPGIFDDYDGYSYEKGSAKSGQYQDATEETDDFAWLAAWMTGYKVDEGINYWLNDEYVHAPSHQWYRNCSPAVERYSYFQENARYANKSDELSARFPRANSTGTSGKGIPYSVFMPVDNLGRYWYEEFVATGRFNYLGRVMHAVQDASIPHHATGYMGNWHGTYERSLHRHFDTVFNANYSGKTFKEKVIELVNSWDVEDASPPNTLLLADKDRAPAINWRVDKLITWMALHACDAYVNTHNNFKNGFSDKVDSYKDLTLKAVAMSVLVLLKAYRAKPSIFVGNKNTKELHFENCGWLNKMNTDNKTEFEYLKDAINDGYNGCYYCMKEYDTDSKD